jgi:hypothetical protein
VLLRERDYEASNQHETSDKRLQMCALLSNGSVESSLKFD